MFSMLKSYARLKIQSSHVTHTLAPSFRRLSRRSGTGRLGGMDKLGSPNSLVSLASSLLLLLLSLLSVSLPSLPLLLLLVLLLLPSAVSHELNTVLAGAKLAESPCCVDESSWRRDDSFSELDESSSLPDDESPHSPPSESSASTSASSS
jgi:hypothetical protein